MSYRYRQEQETIVAANLEDTFAFIAAPASLALLEPPGNDMRLLSGPLLGPGPGPEREYMFRWLGIPVYLQIRVTGFEPPHRLVLDQTLGLWQSHRYAFTLRRVGAGTCIAELADFTAMPGAVDHAIQRFVVARQLRAIAAFRREALLRHLGRSASLPETMHG